MDSVKGTNKEVLRRKRKMLLVLPVIVVPLFTMGFYALGGGRAGAIGNGIVLTKGLNMSLPAAKLDLKKKALTKLGFYKQSDQDSIRLQERRKMDPYYGWKDSSASVLDGGLVNRGTTGGAARPGVLSGLKMEAAPTDLQAAELMHKLELLKGTLNRQQAILPEGLPPGSVSGRQVSSAPGMPGLSGFVGEAPRMGQGDPDLDKLNTLMDKVLRVRYPGDVSLRDTSPAGQVDRPVSALTSPQAEEVMTTLAAGDKDDLETGFIDLDEERRGDSLAEQMIAAVVDGPQTLISGEAVVLRTAADAMLGGVRVPYGTSLSGRATLSGERLLITVNAVRIGSRLLPAALEVVDMDGMTGIRVKGSINRDVAKESADEAVGSLGLTTVEGGVAGQATAAGLQAAKNLLSRKIRLVRVGLPAGYRVLLRNRGR